MVDKYGNYNLTDKGRELLRAHIQVTKPHLYTRGPATPEGKARSRFNGLRHGLYSKAAKLERHCNNLKRRFHATDDPRHAARIKAQLIAKLEELRRWKLSIGEAPLPSQAQPSQEDVPVAVLQENVHWREWVPVDVAAKALGCSVTRLRRLARYRLAAKGKAICANRSFPYGGKAKWYVHESLDARLTDETMSQVAFKRPSKGGKRCPVNRTCPIKNRPGASAKADDAA